MHQDNSAASAGRSVPRKTTRRFCRKRTATARTVAALSPARQVVQVSASCHVRAGPVRPYAASWSSPRMRSPRWRRSQRWPYSLRLGARMMLRTRAPTFTWAAWPDWPRLTRLCLLRVMPCARWPCVAAAASRSSPRWRSPCWRRSQLWSRSWRFSGPGAALHVGIPARLVRARQALSPPRGAARTLSLCCLLRLQRPGPGTGAPHAGGALSCGLGWRLGPGCSGLGPALHVGSLARLVMARQALSPPRELAVCTRSLCGPRQHPGL
jgi:hypothetical protein